MVDLTDEILKILSRHAMEIYPEECCGFVLADGSVHTGTNIQGILNKSQPARYSRDATVSYVLSVADNVLLNISLTSTNPAVLIYHSHPDVGAYFSREDEDKALFAGEPIYPVGYLVIDVRKTGVHEAKLFAWHAPSFVCTKTYRIDRNKCAFLRRGQWSR